MQNERPGHELQKLHQVSRSCASHQTCSIRDIRLAVSYYLDSSPYTLLTFVDTVVVSMTDVEEHPTPPVSQLQATTIDDLIRRRKDVNKSNGPCRYWSGRLKVI